MKQNNSCRIIGVTGGVGAGKSTVLSILQEEYGAYIIRADEVGRMLRAPGSSIYRKILEAFGDSVLNADRTLNSAAVAEIVFSDPEKLTWLNAVSHPLIREQICREIKEASACRSLIALEAALLSEGGLSELCDTVWYVYAPIQVRIARLMESRGYTRERCKKTIRQQKTDRAFRREADAVIDNSTDPERLKKRIARRMKKMNTESLEKI